MLQKILVVGGNGFIGSAVCKTALASGMRVTSISSSGRPFHTPKGHEPAWTDKVDWQKGDALVPETYSRLLDGCTAVVHTTGVLFESGISRSSSSGSATQEPEYKDAVRRGDPFGLAGAVYKSFSRTFMSGNGNPLDERKYRGDYERLNRDAALAVFETFAASHPTTIQDIPGGTGDKGTWKRPFIYVSAEDVSRPLIPARYIETKREAETLISRGVQGREDLRGVFIRPSLVYHSHFRPLTTPVATLIDISATVHKNLPSYMPTPARILRSLARSSPSSPSPHPISLENSSESKSTFNNPTSSGKTDSFDLDSDPDTPGSLSPSSLIALANAMTIPPIHVDHVAQAIVCAILDARVEGVVGVQRMRELIGWKRK